MRRSLTNAHARTGRLICLLASMTLVALCLGGCASSGGRLSTDAMRSGNWAEAARLLTAEAAAAPDDADVHAQLGEVEFRLGRYEDASRSFHRALELNPKLHTAHLYMGYIAETRGDMETALAEYQYFVDAKPKAKQARDAAQRARAIREQSARAFAREAIANEEQLAPATYPDSTIGVVYFRADHLPDSLQPLSKGLAAMTVTDLSKVPALRVVERMRTDKLLDELRLSHSTAFDTSAAPRYGKLLGAARILGGDLNTFGDDHLAISPALVSSNSGDVVLPENQTGEVSQFFRLQKQLVFDIVDRLGIVLTDAQRDSIGRVSTQSLPAFLAYSRGLEFEDRGEYDAANEQFEIALGYDPSFAEARTRARETSYFGDADLSEPRSLETFARRTMGPTEWGAFRATRTSVHLTRLLDNTGLVRSVGDPRGPMGDEPYTPPASGEDAAEVIIHGQFD